MLVLVHELLHVTGTSALLVAAGLWSQFIKGTERVVSRVTRVVRVGSPNAAPECELPRSAALEWPLRLAEPSLPLRDELFCSELNAQCTPRTVSFSSSVSTRHFDSE